MTLEQMHEYSQLQAKVITILEIEQALLEKRLKLEAEMKKLEEAE